MTTPHHDIIVVGSGFSGLGMGIFLKKSGRNDFLILVTFLLRPSRNFGLYEKVREQI